MRFTVSPYASKWAPQAEAASVKGGMFACGVKLCQPRCCKLVGLGVAPDAHAACGGGSIGGLISAGNGHS